MKGDGAMKKSSRTLRQQIREDRENLRGLEDEEEGKTGKRFGRARLVGPPTARRRISASRSW
jgi:hypothetical protein